MIIKRTIGFRAVLLALAMVAAACGSDGETSPTTAVSETDAGQSDPTTTTTQDVATAPPADDYGDPEAYDTDDDEKAGSDHAGDDDDGSASPTESAADDAAEIGTVAEPAVLTPPGTYTVGILGDEWRVATSEPLFVEVSDSKLMVARSEAWGSSGPNLLLFTPVVGIVPPREAGVHQDHHPIVPEATVDLPDSLDAWFDAVPQAVVVDTGAATVAGQPATWWQVTVDAAAGDTFHCPIGDHCIGFVVHEELGVWVLSSDRDITVWQLKAIPNIIGWVQAVDEAAGAEGRRALAALLDGLVAA